MLYADPFFIVLSSRILINVFQIKSLFFIQLQPIVRSQKNLYFAYKFSKHR